jgi:hypothetical protein
MLTDVDPTHLQAAMVRDLAEARESQMRSKLQLQADVAEVRGKLATVLGPPLCCCRRAQPSASARARSMWMRLVVVERQNRVLQSWWLVVNVGTFRVKLMHLHASTYVIPHVLAGEGRV